MSRMKPDRMTGSPLDGETDVCDVDDTPVLLCKVASFIEGLHV